MNADTEQAAWDDWNKWGATVTATPMIREAHRAAYRRALQDAADELVRHQIRLQGTYRKPEWSADDEVYDSGIQHCVQWLRDWLDGRAAAVGVTGDTGGNDD
jgi:hypothetical protein